MILGLASLLSLAANVEAQHLWWDLENQRDAVWIYGEITVLATHPHIYYCGANWHPGEPAGGYCGIQHNGPSERRTIFSVWDTSPALHPEVVAADPETVFNRFGGEGEGAHTHMLWPWKERETFRFIVRKAKGNKPGTIEASYYVFDPRRETWRRSAVISSPEGGERSVATLGGGLNSFLENFIGTDRDVPKLALYRLWLGPDPARMKCLTRAGGDGIWGTLHDAYFLAEGDAKKLDALFASLEARYGKPVMGGRSVKPPPISEKPLPADARKVMDRLARRQTPPLTAASRRPACLIPERESPRGPPRRPATLRRPLLLHTLAGTTNGCRYSRVSMASASWSFTNDSADGLMWSLRPSR